MATQNVAITASPEMIRMLGKKLYSRPLPTILFRELLQNSRDATLHGGKILIDTDNTAGTFTIKCDDTGVGMDDNILLNVFLSVGKSYKSDGAVGGFGVAKVAIFCSDTWSVHTRNNYVDQNLVYQTIKGRKGTQVNCQVKNFFDGTSSANFMAYTSNVRNLWLNGDKVPAYKGRRLVGEYNGAKVYMAPPVHGNRNYILWRICGLTQFYSHLGSGNDDYGCNFIVDFDNISYRPVDDKYPFNASRENVKDEYMNYVLRITAPFVKNVLTTQHKAIKMAKTKREPREKVRFSSNNRVVVEGPKNLTPHQRRTVDLWEKVISAMVPDSAFMYGSTFEAGTRAERRIEHGRETYLINPEEFDQLILRNNITDPEALVMLTWQLAGHELTHQQYSDHDELFTSTETSVAAQTVGFVFAGMAGLRWQAKKVLTMK